MADLARSVRGDSSLYITAEQEVWREPGSTGDGLGVFVVEVGQQAVDVVVGMTALLGALQGSDERFQEGVQARAQAMQQARRHLGIQTRLLQANTKSLVHRSPLPSADTLPPRRLYANDLRPSRSTTQSK
jgi:hypothetical protein